MQPLTLSPSPRLASTALAAGLILSASACDISPDFSGWCLFGPCDESSGPGTATPPMLTFSVQPAEAAAGMPLVPAVEVSALDWGWQPNQDFAGAVVLYVEDASGVPFDTASATAQGGVAVFDSLVIDSSGTGFRLWATAAGFSPVNSLPFAVTPAGAVVDQEQKLMDGTSNRWAVGGAASDMLAQVVTAGIAGTLVAVRFPIACDGDLTLEIRDVAGDAPGDSVLAAEAYPPNSVAYEWTNAFYSLVLQTPVPVAVGDRLAVVLRSFGACTVARGPEGDPYAGGSGFHSSWPDATGTWASLGARADLPFQTLVR